MNVTIATEVGVFLDTGIMIELLRRRRSDPLVGRILREIEGERLFWSTFQFAEFADYCRRSGKDLDAQVRRVSALVEEIPVDRDIALMASSLKMEAREIAPRNPFGLGDGIILATARTIGEKLITLDTDFDVFPDVHRVEFENRRGPAHTQS